MKKKLEEGMIQVYTGNSKGKTTAALGLALRAIGHHFHIAMVQFLKGSSYAGEIFAAERLYPQLEIYSYGYECPRGGMIKSGETKCVGCMDCFVMPGKITDEDREITQLAMDCAKRVTISGDYDIVILDEISNPVNLGLIDEEEVLDLIDRRPQYTEMVLTGRSMPDRIIEAADLVTEMVEIKHPFQKGKTGRRGIEF